MAAPDIIEPIMQKSDWDCGIACLAMITGRPFVEVMQIVRARYKSTVDVGMDIRQVIGAAKHLGFELTSVPIPDELDEETGILKVRLADGEVSGHYVILFNGVVYNPASGLLYSPEGYLAVNKKGRYTRLLKP